MVAKATRYARRRRRRVASVVNDLTDAQWSALRDAWSGCAYCEASNRPLQKDCVQAISRGGRYTLSNIAPACGSCNASKCNFEVTAWLRRKGLDEKRFLERYVSIRGVMAAQFPDDPGT